MRTNNHLGRKRYWCEEWISKSRKRRRKFVPLSKMQSTIDNSKCLILVTSVLLHLLSLNGVEAEKRGCKRKLVSWLVTCMIVQQHIIRYPMYLGNICSSKTPKSFVVKPMASLVQWDVNNRFGFCNLYSFRKKQYFRQKIEIRTADLKGLCHGSPVHFV